MRSIHLIIRYVRGYLWPLGGAVGSLIFLVGVQLAAPWMVKLLVANVQDAATGSGSLQFISMLALGVLALFLLRGVFRFSSSYLAHVAGWGVVAESRRDVYQHLQRQSLRFYEDRQTGELMSRTVNDTDKFEHLVSHALPDTLVNVLSLIGVAAVMLAMNAKLMLLTLVPIPFIVLATRAFAKFVRPAFHERQEDLAVLNAHLQDNISGIREIQAFNREEREAKHIWGRILQFRNSNLKALRLMATFQSFIEFTSSMGTIVVIYFGGRLAFNMVLPIEDLVAFFLYLEMFYHPIRMLTAAWEHTQEAVVGAERVQALLDEEPDIQNGHAPRDLGRAEGRIDFRNVSFQYTRGEPVLEEIDLRIQPRTVTALVGPTGVGKTTLAGLIPRFYDATQGSVLVDGVDVRELDLQSLRSNISLVLQDVFLFNGTVRDNILFGNPHASEAHVREAATVANADEFIRDLPDGYDTRIGERGVKLSGGQKQRISIARAVLKDAPILILDEATSSVDTYTEVLIQQALERLMKGRTTIVIAHRLSTIRKADLIVVLAERRIREMGTHDDLIEQRGMYHHLSTMQAMV